MLDDRVDGVFLRVVIGCSELRNPIPIANHRYGSGPEEANLSLEVQFGSKANMIDARFNLQIFAK